MKLLIVDDHPVVREGLVALLQQLGPGTVVLQAGDAPSAFDLAERTADLDVIVLDLVLPGMTGLTATGEFGRRRPDVPVIVLSSSDDVQDAWRALAEGALGYVPKSASQHTLLAAIGQVMMGERYVPRLPLEQPFAMRTATAAHRPSLGVTLLTERQVDVLRRLGQGHANKVIAFDLDLSEKTVKAHVTAIFRALNVVNRTQAAAAGRTAGLI